MQSRAELDSRIIEEQHGCTSLLQASPQRLASGQVYPGKLGQYHCVSQGCEKSTPWSDAVKGTEPPVETGLEFSIDLATASRGGGVSRLMGGDAILLIQAVTSMKR